MGRSKAEDRKLGEVKAVLQHLQRMAADPASVGQRSAEEVMAHTAQSFMRRKAALTLLGGAVLTSVLAVGYAFITVSQNRSPPSTMAVAPQVSSVVRRADALPPVPALQAAMGLMAAGRIQLARQELLRLTPEETADVAWALARTYDPNFLATIPVADAGPNVAEATRWYRTWYAVAVKQGLVGDSVSLDRIIRSMR
jgi:hypothetical protein